jgi:hypothetical protein
MKSDLKEAVRKILDEEGEAGPALSEQQFLREFISFANTQVLGRALASIPGLVPDDVDQCHGRFRSELQSLVDRQMSKADQRRIYAEADRVIMIPRTAADGSIRYRYVPESLKAALAHAMRLLLDAEKPHGEDLKQCQWRDCNDIRDARNLPHVCRFFFVSERREAATAAGRMLTGKLPDRYCCEEHMRAAHRARATEATQKRRKEIRERKLKAKTRNTKDRR